MSNKQTADILLRSTAIFTATDISLINGYVAVSGNKILAVGTGNGSEFLSSETLIYELGNKLICPGFSDVHCFFTGFAAGYAGVDISEAATVRDAILLLKDIPLFNNALILGHGWNMEAFPNDNSTLQSLEEAFGSIPVILFEKGGDTCIINKSAAEIYQFTSDTCYPESYWRLLKEILNNREFIIPALKDYMAMLNGRGVTSVKEMGFDNFYGFTDTLKELEKSSQLTLRVNFMSQPVGFDADMQYGIDMKNYFSGDFVRFSGFNQMTDGSISQLYADLKEPYTCTPGLFCSQEIDYEKIEQEVLAADKLGFRFSLHAQGDAAIHKAIQIFSKCQKKPDGKLLNRHSITDLEFSDPADLEQMGELGIIAEIYPQIQSIAERSSKLAMIEEKIGKERGRYYWNRRKMADSKVILSCATDLPLLIDNIPESIYHACGGWFPEGGEAYNKENTLTIPELLKAWTKGGAYNLYCEDTLGTLEAGKKADIAVLNENIFETALEDIRHIQVCLTFIDGIPVYQAL
ncbi:hypothetical protein SAMN02745136_02527 [Anaerocolumna jejuensis DSM 15929]|uniref:Amidohydrolase 3 domain-containing protein n=1 Tax=Anaerocolumna jejuensis DSM 15929 TaxID=1121322 RepID=A0A1M6SNH1_9FIRM|nr:amidohydrolase family protein [Anaerocolumna jejuensis]SHK46158.1 hypothetical protein SAMN02745136_02527 [Anaerocolumna jejuensis DSM 15929]